MKYILILSCFLLFSCSNKIPFDKAKWNVKEDVFYDYREFMIDDLLSKKIIIGKNIQELEDLFGKLEVLEEENNKIIVQNIVTDFGFDIDPIKTVNLVIYLNENDVAIKTELIKWENKA